eukprot:4094310-Amphidinium_carterae.1
MACKAFTTPLQSLTILWGWHSSKLRTTAKSSASEGCYCVVLTHQSRQCTPALMTKAGSWVGRAPGGGAGKRPCRRTHAGASSA